MGTYHEALGLGVGRESFSGIFGRSRKERLGPRRHEEAQRPRNMVPWRGFDAARLRPVAEAKGLHKQSET
jgi:hypothetical protein